MKRQFIEKTSMARSMGKCSTSLEIREMKIYSYNEIPFHIHQISKNFQV